MWNHYKYRFFVLWICCMFTGFSSLAQGSAKKLKSEGLTYFDHQQYRQALNMFLKYQRIKKGDLEVYYKTGVAYYHTNQLPEARKILLNLIENGKKANPKAYYYLGKIEQAALDFKSAIKQYKQYLRHTKPNQSDRNSVKDAIRRCASGLRASRQEELAVVENLGEEVNGTGDDFGPVKSPNYDDKIYFSTSRKGNIGGLRDKNGLRDSKHGNYNADIYSSVIINGRWSATMPLSSLINSPRHDVLLDFNSNGSVMYFFKGGNLREGQILVDTFSQQSEGRMLFPTSCLVSPVAPENGDGALFFFNDSTLLFSSHRNGGYGGYDLYITAYRAGQWSEPENLGPAINSAYDETSPFLSKDGRTLYFSSNNRKSIGGMDVFKTYFDESTRSWNRPANLGLPINSAADDSYFRLTPDGLKAFFSSSRKDGFGKLDIYIAYFKTAQSEQLAALPNLFTDSGRQDVAGQHISSGPTGTEGTNGHVSSVHGEMRQFEFPLLFYKSDDDVLNSANLRTLNKVVQLLKAYPQVQLALNSHSDASGPLEFSIYFSIKRAEKVAQYLVEQGIDADRIELQGSGPNYPIAKNLIKGEASAHGQKFNRRIELIFFNLENQPLQISYDRPNLNAYADPSNEYYKKLTEGLSYKIQIAAIKQMYNSPVFLAYPDPMVEKSADMDTYRYTVGLYKTFSSANQLRSELVRQGIKDAFVVPYIDGRRINRSEAVKRMPEHRDLLQFLSSSE